MTRRILITGATDGIGLETATELARRGHHILVHGRDSAKVDRVAASLEGLPAAGQVDRYVADLSHMDAVDALAEAVARDHDRLDVLINNAGVLKSADPVTSDGFDLRFAVNTFAPWRLATRLLPLVGAEGRIVNLSSAAQAPVDLAALAGKKRLADMDAYAQSKLALTMWSRQLAESLGNDGPVVVAVNPGSLLATKMVRDGFGVAGSDVAQGADVLVRAALDDEFATASGRYFDNDIGRFGPPHADALDDAVSRRVLDAMKAALGETRSPRILQAQPRTTRRTTR